MFCGRHRSKNSVFFRLIAAAEPLDLLAVRAADDHGPSGPILGRSGVSIGTAVDPQLVMARRKPRHLSRPESISGRSTWSPAVGQRLPRQPEPDARPGCDSALSGFARAGPGRALGVQLDSGLLAGSPGSRPRTIWPARNR